MRAGLLTSEFWLIVTLLGTGVVLAFYDPTRELGAALLGAVVRDVRSYLKARTELKLANLGADDGSQELTLRNSTRQPDG